MYAACWCLTVVSGTVYTHQEITLFTCHVLRSSECVASRNESLSIGHLEISFQLEAHADSRCSNFMWVHPPLPLVSSFPSSPFSYSCPLCRWYRAFIYLFLYLWRDRTWFIWQAFNPACPSASDRKHPRACVSTTKSGSLSFTGCNLQPECTATNHIYSCTLELRRVKWSGIIGCFRNILWKKQPLNPHPSWLRKLLKTGHFLCHDCLQHNKEQFRDILI